MLLLFLKGKHVVGAKDIMTGPDIEKGSLIRLYYPCEIEDIHVMPLRHILVHAKILLLIVKLYRKIRRAGLRGYQTKNTLKATVQSKAY